MDAADEGQPGARETPVRRTFGFHSAGLLILSVALAGGCTFTSSERLLSNFPPAPSAAYVPGASISEGAATDDGAPPSLDGRVLNLAQCIEIALDRNPETHESWQRIRAAAAGVGQARAAYLPTVGFTAGASRSDQVILDGRQNTGPLNIFDAGFGLRYLLYDGGARSAGLQGAEAELLDAGFQHNATLQDVALNVEEAYYRVLADTALERVADQTVVQTQYHVDIARARHDNGLVARSDVLKAETEKANADLLLVRARSQVRIARGELASAMGLKPTESFQAAELPLDVHQREAADIKRLMDEAAAGRPELQAALARVASERARLKTMKARYWPEITLNTDYGWRDRTFLPTQPEWSLGVGVSWSLFEGFNRDSSVRRAQSDLAGSIAQHQRLLRGVELEVWTAYSQLTEAGQAIEAAHVLVASAEESARVAEGQYKNGTASILEVTDAQTARTTANVRLVQAELDWYTAMARLERAVGRTLARVAHGDNGDDQP